MMETMVEMRDGAALGQQRSIRQEGFGRVEVARFTLSKGLPRILPPTKLYWDTGSGEHGG
jgi:hypothetical protein